MTGRRIVVVGLGNSCRTDDAVGVAVATALKDVALPDVHVVTGIVDPLGLLEAWAGAGLAIVVDAAVATPSVPGRIRRCALAELVAARGALSCHSVDVPAAYALGQALGRLPDALVVFTVEAGDTGYGIGMTPRIATAVPEVVRLVVAEIGSTRRPGQLQGGGERLSKCPDRAD